jgi:hypothetical protein
MLDREVIFALRMPKTEQKGTIRRQVNHLNSVHGLRIPIHSPLPVELRVQRTLFGVFSRAYLF